MKELVIETGLVSYTLNGGGVLTFNPTDSAFVERLYSTFSALDQKQEEYKAEVENAREGEIFAVARRRDEEMRRMIDQVLGEGVAADVFGGMNVYALAGGLPVWANLLLAVMDEIDDSFAREQKAMNPRLDKYLKKYKRK